MKQLVLVLSFSLVAIHLRSQDIYSDPNFLKATNIMWCACYSLKNLDAERVSGQNVEEKKDQTISALKKNLVAANKLYEIIKLKYPKDYKQVINLKQWLDVLEKIDSDYLPKDNWQNEPVWALGYTMIKMDLEDITNQKLIK